MRHIVVLLIVALGIYLLATRKSDLDILMAPVANYAEAQVGNRFVEVDRDKLPITPKDLAESGVVTVVYFHDDTCYGCGRLDRDLNDFLRVRPDVAVRKVRMSLNGDAYYQAIKDYQWKIYTAPCILIFGKDGKLIAADERTNSTGQDLLEEWMSKELTQAANRS